MKIISKFKDFYDYKMTKYGVDEKLVYTRKTYCEYNQKFIVTINKKITDKITEENFNKNLKENTEYFKGSDYHKILIIGKKIVHLFFTENRIYSHLDIKNPKDIEKSYGYWAYYTDIKVLTFNDGKKYEIFSAFRLAWDNLFSCDRERVLSYMGILEDNVLFNEPMILIEYLGKVDRKNARFDNSIYKITYNPNLSQIGIYFDEDFIWQSLVEFLSIKRSEKEIVPEVSNENKILSKGFDLKSSFRPNMKKKK